MPRLHWISGGREYSAELYDTKIDGSVPNFTCRFNGQTYYRELMQGTVPNHSFVVQSGTIDQMFLREAAIREGATTTQHDLMGLMVNALVTINGNITYNDTIQTDDQVLFAYQLIGNGYQGRNIQTFRFRGSCMVPIDGQYSNGSGSWYPITEGGNYSLALWDANNSQVFIQEDLYWDLM